MTEWITTTPDVMTSNFNPNTKRTSGTKRHPVADNPLRILHGKGWNTLDELRRTARIQKLLARKGPITPTEPFSNIIIRIRSEEDYLDAEVAVSKPDSLALALAFSINEDGLFAHLWKESALQNTTNASMLLLMAEAAPQGSARKTECINQAIRAYDVAASQGMLRDLVEKACLKASQLTGSSVDTNLTYNQFQHELVSIVEQAISDLGDSIDSSKLDLLATLEENRTFPEVSGLGSAINNVINSQMAQLHKLHESSMVIFQASKETRTLGLAEMSKFMAEVDKGITILKNVEKYPFLLKKFDKPSIDSITQQLAALAWNFGFTNNKWVWAARCVDGLRSGNIQGDDEFARAACRAVIRLAPVMANGTVCHKVDVIQTVLALYPLLKKQLEDLETKIWEEEAIRLSPPNTRQNSTSTPVGHNERFPNAAASANQWRSDQKTVPGSVEMGDIVTKRSRFRTKALPVILGVIGLLFLIFIVQCAIKDSNENYSSTSFSGSSPVSSPSSIPPASITPSISTTSARERMKSSMDAQLLLIKQMEKSLEAKELTLKSMRPNVFLNAQIDDFNRRVDEYNSEIEKYKAMLREYNERVLKYNAKQYDR